MKNNRIQLSDHFNYQRLLRFTLPSIVMMVFTSIYGVVDGFFVSNYVGKTSFAAVNFIMPFLMILGAVGFMFGTGGSALIAKTLGQRDREKANRLFSMIVYVSIVCGVVLMILGFVLIRSAAVWLGASGSMLSDCLTYGYPIMIAVPAYIIQFAFASFFITAEKPKLGLMVTILAGITNMVMDFLLVAVLRWGLTGAALATALSQYVGGGVSLGYFARKNTSLLCLTRTKLDKAALWKTCTNGSSELMSNISISIVSMLYNAQLMKYAGENGIAAYGVIMYVNMIFLAIFLGYSIGCAPVMGYHYGAENNSELKNLLKRSLCLIGVFSILMFVLAELLAMPLAALFVGYDAILCELTVRGFQFYSFSFLFSGMAIFGSSFFTALNNGFVSALISFLRTMVFQMICVLILPLWWGIDGIWISVVAAEMLAVIVTVVWMYRLRSFYHYG